MVESGDYAPQVDYYVHRLCTPAWEIEPSTTDFIDLTYVVGGSAQYIVDEMPLTVRAGDLLCIPQGSQRRAFCLPGELMECYSVNFTLHTHLGEQAALPFPMIQRIGARSDIIALYRDLNAEWLRREPGYGMKVRAIMLLILHRYFELIVYKTDSGLLDKRVEKAMRHITDHYAEPLTIRQLSELAGLNPIYFGNLFKRSTGMSFRQYLCSIRLNHAEDMLRSGEYNVNETAHLCGFGDIFYFSKVYKESRGASPSNAYKAD